MKKSLTLLSLVLASTMLSACVGAMHPWLNRDTMLFQSKPVVAAFTNKKVFDDLPELDGAPIPVAIYSFTDKTGQRKSSSSVSSFSTAVTQGADAYLVKTLADVGGGKWFKPVERVGIDSLIKERQLIRQMREQEFGEKATPLPPLMVAGLIIEGGIIDYNSNTKTGGNGVRYLGIGPNTQYSEDMVVINLRLVSTQTGEVLDSVTVNKNVISTSEGITVFKFFDLGTKAFEVDGQQTANEPGSYAVRSAIELGVAQLIKDGEKKGLWHYKKTTDVQSTKK
jgi:curli production assembly/transport component CsgG